MTPKEKAKQMLKTFDNIPRYAKKAVDEIIKETKLHDKTIYQHGRTFYWQEVKKEII